VGSGPRESLGDSQAEYNDNDSLGVSITQREHSRSSDSLRELAQHLVTITTESCLSGLFAESQDPYRDDLARVYPASAADHGGP